MLTRLNSKACASEWALWIVFGIVAALVSALPDWNLRIPGHAILRSVFPMTLGLALARRHWAGAVMGGVGLTTSLGLHAAGYADLGLGALTSLALTGPLLDVALRRATTGWRLYLGVVIAGLGSNLAAFGVKAAEKLTSPRGRSFSSWLAEAAWTYPVCGIVAGLISAAVFFRWRERRGVDGAASDDSGMLS